MPKKIGFVLTKNKKISKKFSVHKKIIYFFRVQTQIKSFLL